MVSGQASLLKGVFGFSDFLLSSRRYDVDSKSPDLSKHVSSHTLLGILLAWMALNIDDGINQRALFNDLCFIRGPPVLV